VAEAAKKKGAPTAKKDIPAAKKGAPQRRRPPVATPTMPLAERIGIQFDLAFAGYYNGLINGEFNERSMAACARLQKDNTIPRERCAGGAGARFARAPSRGSSAGTAWRMVEDKATARSVLRPHSSRIDARQERHPAGRRRRARCRSRLPRPRTRRDARHRVRAAEEGSRPAASSNKICCATTSSSCRAPGAEEVYVRAQVKDQECAA